MKKTLLILAFSLTVFASPAGRAAARELAPPACPDPIECASPERCRDLVTFYDLRSALYANEAGTPQKAGTDTDYLIRRAFEDKQCALDVRKRNIFFTAECRDFKTCHAKARQYSIQTQAKIEENRLLYKTDYSKAKENEVAIRALDGQTQAALAKAKQSAIR